MVSAADCARVLYLCLCGPCRLHAKASMVEHPSSSSSSSSSSASCAPFSLTSPLTLPGFLAGLGQRTHTHTHTHTHMHTRLSCYILRPLSHLFLLPPRVRTCSLSSNWRPTCHPESRRTRHAGSARPNYTQDCPAGIGWRAKERGPREERQKWRRKARERRTPKGGMGK